MIEENNSPLKQKGGFAKSSGSRGKGGRNVGGYNVNTSFAVKPAWKKPRSGGFIGAVASPKPTKPYTIDDKGKVEVEPLTPSPLLPDGNFNYNPKDEKGKVKVKPPTSSKTLLPNGNFNYNPQSENSDITAPDVNYEKPKSDIRVMTPEELKNKKVEANYGKEEGKLPTYREAWDNNNEGVKDRKGKDGKAKYKNFEEFEADAMNYKKETPAKAKQEVSAAPFKLKGSPMYRNFGVGGKPKK